MPSSTRARGVRPSVAHRPFATGSSTNRSGRPIRSSAATLALLELAGGRFEVAEVLDFLALGPVRQRFRFDDEDLADMTEWASGTNVRWGVDPAPSRSLRCPRGHRQQHLGCGTRPAPGRGGGARRRQCPRGRRRAPLRGGRNRAQSWWANSQRSSGGCVSSSPTHAVRSLCGSGSSSWQLSDTSCSLPTARAVAVRRPRPDPRRHPRVGDLRGVRAGDTAGVGRREAADRRALRRASRLVPTTSGVGSPSVRSPPCDGCPSGWSACSVWTSPPWARCQRPATIWWLHRLRSGIPTPVPRFVSRCSRRSSRQVII